MWKDEIVEEIRKIREEHAKKFNEDLKAIYLDLKEDESKSDLKFIAPPSPRKPKIKSA